MVTYLKQSKQIIVCEKKNIDLLNCVSFIWSNRMSLKYRLLFKKNKK